MLVFGTLTWKTVLVSTLKALVTTASENSFFFHGAVQICRERCPQDREGVARAFRPGGANCWRKCVLLPVFCFLWLMLFFLEPLPEHDTCQCTFFHAYCMYVRVLCRHVLLWWAANNIHILAIRYQKRWSFLFLSDPALFYTTLPSFDGLWIVLISKLQIPVRFIGLITSLATLLQLLWSSMLLASIGIK